MAIVKNAYTTKELSELLSVSRQAIDHRAKRESWQSHPRQGRGGGYEWLLESMPESTRQAVATAIAASIASATPQSPRVDSSMFTVNTLADIPEHKRERAGARALLVSMAREFGAASGAPRTAAYEVFAHEYNRGAISAPDWARTLLPRVCRASLCNWEDAMSGEGLAALAGKQGQHRKGKGVIDSTPGMAEHIISELVNFHNISAASIMEALEAKFKGQRLPTLRGLQRWVKDYRAQNEQVLLKIQNPDGWRSKYQAAAGSRSAGIERINQLWEMDSSPTDLLLADSKRYTLIGVVDVASRRGKLQLVKNSNSSGVCSLLRRSFLDFGIPESLKLDNGSEYVGYQVTTTIHDLGIIPDYCPPFSPEQKPHVERFFKTFQHGFCVRLPGFIGHCVADRKAIESRRSFAERISKKQGEKPAIELRYTPEEFQAICDSWCQDIYNERVHSELGVSPNDAAAQGRGTLRRIADERALDLLLMPLARNNGICRVTKKGLRIDCGDFHSPLLGGLEGQDVQVRRDEHDAGYAYVFNLDGIFICRAEDPNLTGVSLRELALARKAHQKAIIGEKVKEAKRIAAKIKPHETVAMILDHKAEVAAQNRARRATETGVDYTTPALDQAALAARAADMHIPTPMTPEEVSRRDALVAELAARPDGREPETLEDLDGREAFYAAMRLEERIRDRAPLTPEQTKWLLGYQSTYFYSTWRNMYEDFGDSMFDGMKFTIAL